jgi:hypothetical protein
VHDNMKIPSTPVVEREAQPRGLSTSALSADANNAEKPVAVKAYEVICISIYRSDLEAVDKMVVALKARGHAKANRSLLIRLGLSRLSLDEAAAAIAGARL